MWLIHFCSVLTNLRKETNGLLCHQIFQLRNIDRFVLIISDKFTLSSLERLKFVVAYQHVRYYRQSTSASIFQSTIVLYSV
jgi:hypothetical protein